MSHYALYTKYKDFELDKLFRDIPGTLIDDAIKGEEIGSKHFISLLSSAAGDCLESLAKRAHQLTLRNFGKTVQLYTPMYLSNYCDNQCVYCGFSSKNNIERKKLNLEEVKKEAEFIFSTGLKHILILSGESREESPVSYIKDCVQILKEYFSSISIEIYPLEDNEYAELISSGVDGLTIYQEVYNEELYYKLHPVGPKRNYRFRLGAPERGAKAGMRNVNIGVLLGLDDWRKEIFFMGLHAKYLQDKFPDVEIGISIPRIRPQVAGFKATCEVSDKDLVQIILALRIFLPRSQITLSTRESPELRNNLIPLGITRMSAGSSTFVGGRIVDADNQKEACQFEISDHRGVDEMKLVLQEKGYQAVLKDWMHFSGNF